MYVIKSLGFKEVLEKIKKCGHRNFKEISFSLINLIKKFFFL